MNKLIEQIKLYGFDVEFKDARKTGHVSETSNSTCLISVTSADKPTVARFEFVCEEDTAAKMRGLDNILKKIETLTDTQNETKKK